jgi:hypothetical protein
MINYLIYTLLIITFLKIPGLIAYFIAKKRNRGFIEPFAYYLCFSVICDLFLLVTSHYGIFNLYAINIIHLIDAYLLLWIFFKFKKTNTKPKIEYAIAILFTISWLVENLFISNINTINYYTVYLIAFYFSFAGADYLISKTFATEQKVTIDARFIFVCGFFIFICIDLITLPFIIPKSNSTLDFYDTIYKVRSIGFSISQLIYNYCIYICLLKMHKHLMR